MLKPLESQNDSEKKIAQLIRIGNKMAFEEFFYEHYKGLFILSVKYLKDDVLAEDAIQEIFSKIWINRDLINPDQSLKSYLYTIAKNYLLNALRDNRRIEKKIVEYAILHKNNIYEELSESDRSRRIFEAIDTLPKKRRIIAKLKLYKGLDNQQVSQKLKISVNTVKFQYSLALKQIRKLQ